SAGPLGRMPTDVLLFACFGVMAAVIHIVHRQGVAVSRLFEQRHPDTYKSLGCPHASYTDLVANSRFDRFILRGRYRELEDPESTQVCDRLRRHDLFVLGVIWVGVAFAAWWLIHL